MKLAIISDTHFGDNLGTIVTFNKQNRPKIGPHYEKFKNAAGQDNDYLVLLGDIWDLSIASYKLSYDCAKVFFKQIKKDNIAKQIIYVPGNHDADMWHMVEHQANVINKVIKGDDPEILKLSVPGIIDDRAGSPYRGFQLHGVTKRTGKIKYGGMFLDHITKPATIFNFAYPNIYMVTDKESVLFTHGQYLEEYWSFASEWIPKLAQEDLKIGGTLNMKEYVGINFPLSQLACSGVGQAPPFTSLVRKIQTDVKKGDLKDIRIYLDRLDYELDNMSRFPWYKAHLEWLTDSASNSIKKLLLEQIGKIDNSRFSERFYHKKEVQNRFMNYYKASAVEISQLNDSVGYDIPLPHYVVFGHTHHPIPWGALDAPKTDLFASPSFKPITLFNTGGWLYKEKNGGNKEFCGAEVLVYETGKGFKSIPIRE